jgi:hypothetical protein
MSSTIASGGKYLIPYLFSPFAGDNMKMPTGQVSA